MTLAGSYCTRLMADLGAEVIKVEPPVTGDETRTYPYLSQEVGSGYFIQFNCGKKSMTLDLNRSEAIQIVMDLARKCDVLVEDFKPGLLNRFGLAYEQLKEINPLLIMCSITPFGQTGPYAENAGCGLTAEALSGLLELTGYENGPPLPFGYAVADPTAGAQALGVISAALLHRTKTGRGQHIDLSVADCALSIHCNAMDEYLFTAGEIKRSRTGPQRRNLTPYGVYPCRDGHVVIVAVLNAWELLANGMGRPELATDPRFSTPEARCQNDTEVTKLLTEWLHTFESAREAAEFIAGEVNVMAAPVLSRQEALSDAQNDARQMLVDVRQSESRKLKVMNTPFKCSRSDVGPKKPAPGLGQHNQEVLVDVLGYSLEHVARLRESGIVA
jgi:crotonobetainyl-CoA:carnitine CoA-transferase CaiB-like acyl-CoA transferase